MVGKSGPPPPPFHKASCQVEWATDAGSQHVERGLSAAREPAPVTARVFVRRTPRRRKSPLLRASTARNPQEATRQRAGAERA